MCFVIVPRRQAPEVLRIAHAIDPEVFLAVEDIRQTSLSRDVGPFSPTGWRSVLKMK
jgi:hypothetical protein